MDFRNIGLANRYKLLLALSHRRKRDGSGAANTVFEITTKAIKCDYIQDRETPAGAMLERWIKNRNPPAWAAKATARLLAEAIDYSPQEEAEKLAFSLTLVEALPDQGPEAIYEELPKQLQDSITLGLIQEAYKHKKQEKMDI